MRIISNFRDYYDGVTAYGHDASVIYERKTVRRDDVVELQQIPDIMPAEYPVQHWLLPGVLGFCGKLLPLVCTLPYRVERLSQELPDDQLLPGGEPHWNADELSPPEKRDRHRSWRKTRWALGWGLTLEQFFATDFSSLSSVFAQHRVPTWLCYRRRSVATLVLNPELRALGFAKIKPPFECFQDIENYISGVLGASKEVTEIPDAYRAQAHGFDKWSFRRPPEDK